MAVEVPAEDPREMRLYRELRAPRALVWAALSDPAHLGRWWGPSGFRTETEAHELRPGGAWRFFMHGPDGRAYPNHAVFDEVDPPRRLVLRYIRDDDPAAEVHVTTLTLDELAPDRTGITLCVRFPTAELRREIVEKVGAIDGGRQTLARLAAFVEGEGPPPADGAVYTLQRVLAAPPERVWAAWTDAQALARWFHPRAWTISSASLDLRVGGRFVYAFRGPQLPDTWAVWRFTELDPPRRLGFELCFADPAGEPAASPFGGPWPLRTATTVTLEPHAGIGRGTVLRLRAEPLQATAEERAAFAGALPSMEVGWGETVDSLAAFLAEPG